MIEITEAYVIYQAESKLLEIATEIAKSRSIQKAEIQAKIQKATKIRLWLEALDYKTYLDRNTREKIWYCLMDVANIDQTPVTVPTSTISAPSIIVGIKGDKGDTGATGSTGGGVSFSASNVAIDTVVDSFDTSLSSAAEWQYEVFNGSNKRVERLTGGWLGSTPTDDGGLATTDIGDTSGISFTVNISGSTVQLLALVTSGTWTVRGSRILIPVSGNGITLPTSLNNGTIWIGNASNQPTSQTLAGDVVMTNAGVTAITSGVIVNADINNSAAIAVSKLAPMTASKAVVTDSNGFLTTSTTAASKVDFLANVTSDIQTQINTIAGAGTITGAITTYVASNAIANRAVIANAAGKLTTALTTDTEIGYLSGVTSSVQTQLNTKVTSNVVTSVKIIDIGDWNMDSTGVITVAHGLTFANIRGVSVTIRNDLNTVYYPIEYSLLGVSSGSVSVQSTDIALLRTASGFFDTTDFDSTSYNRGWITITYV